MTNKNIIDNFLSSKEEYKKFYNDEGVRLLLGSVLYISQQNIDEITNNIAEVLNPQDEFYVIATMLYQNGFFRTKTTNTYNIELTSDKNYLLKRDTRFSIGKSIFLLTKPQNIKAQESTNATIELAMKETIKATVEESSLFYHIKTNKTFHEIIRAEVFNNGNKLTYSQNFINGEFSYELNADKTVTIVVLLNGEHSIINGSQIICNVYYNYDDDIDTPTELICLDNQDIQVENITVNSQGKPTLTIEDMRKLIKYGKNLLGDRVLNDDYKNFILNNVRDIDSLKVWQQAEQEQEFPPTQANINKLFICVISTKTDIQDKITSLFNIHQHGKNIEFIAPEIILLDISLNIARTVSSHSISAETVSKIRKELIGIYDEVEFSITNTYVNRVVLFHIDIPVEISITMSDKGDFSNKKFYQIKDNSLSISIQ